jgi:hypothetical protein
MTALPAWGRLDPFADNRRCGQMLDQSGTLDDPAFDQKFAHDRLCHHGTDQYFQKLSLLVRHHALQV